MRLTHQVEVDADQTGLSDFNRLTAALQSVPLEYVPEHDRSRCEKLLARIAEMILKSLMALTWKFWRHLCPTMDVRSCYLHLWYREDP